MLAKQVTAFFWDPTHFSSRLGMWQAQWSWKTFGKQSLQRETGGCDQVQTMPLC